MNSPTGFAPGRFSEWCGSPELAKIASDMEKEAFLTGLGSLALKVGKGALKMFTSPFGSGAKTVGGKALQRGANFVGSMAAFEGASRALTAGAPPPPSRLAQRFNYGLSYGR